MRNRTARVLIVGTCDTKENEIGYVAACVRQLGARPIVMDVSVLGESGIEPDFTRHDVAAACGMTNEAIIALGDENLAMTKTAEGASNIAAGLSAAEEIDAMVALGGTMGTDLALDVAAALPFGMPKVVLSTVSFSPLVPIARVSSDLIMVLWSGGLYGLNEMSRSSIRLAVGAAVGGASYPPADEPDRPVVAISSLGTSALHYVIDLVPAIESRGFEAAVFHATGMGGRALAEGARNGRFVAVFDFCLQEVVNDLFGSQVTSGPDRLRAGTVPRLIAPGGVDMIDAVASLEIPPGLQDREFHQHNRLITSAKASVDERKRAAAHIAGELALSTAPTSFLLPRRGVGEWDRPGGPLHDAAAISAMGHAFASEIHPPVELIDLDCHINDPEFTAAALAEFDRWVTDGVVVSPIDT